VGSIVTTPSQVASATAHAATAPFKTTFLWPTGESASGSSANRVLIPNAQSRKTMAETEAGKNVVNFASIDDLFAHLDS
jgi:hypothetical protein